MLQPTRRTDELHKGRFSLSGARYFATLVTHDREPWLHKKITAQALLTAFQAWHIEGDGKILAATVMPDHAHVLFELGPKLSAGQCIGRWKSSVRRTLSYVHDWQRDFWEHRLRPEDSAEDYALYVFLNPYRARLIEPSASWPWWWTPEPKAFLFTGNLDVNGAPPVEWIGWSESRFERLMVGE